MYLQYYDSHGSVSFLRINATVRFHASDSIRYSTLVFGTVCGRAQAMVLEGQPFGGYANKSDRVMQFHT